MASDTRRSTERIRVASLNEFYQERAVPMHKTLIDSRPKRGAWAPGSYLCHCYNCGQKFQGDKLAMSCADCAYNNNWLLGINAPRDGTRILIWVPSDDDGETYKVAYWGPKPNPTGWVYRGGWLAAGEVEFWRPLPEPPPISEQV